MAQCLLAAEADQIQDFIFRASRLREVVGGSQLLSRFCQEGAERLLKHHGGNPDTDIIVNDGGAFRIRFPDRHKAHDFGRDLAELYRRTTGGTLTVAEPVDYRPHFSDTNQHAQEKLREGKNRGNQAAPSYSIRHPKISQRDQHHVWQARCGSMSCMVGLRYKVGKSYQSIKEASMTVPQDNPLPIAYLATARLGEKGQITVPKEYRDALALEAGAPITMLRLGSGLILIPEHDRFRQLCDRVAQTFASHGIQAQDLLATLPEARQQVFEHHYPESSARKSARKKAKR